MSGRQKIIDGLECCYNLQRGKVNRTCEQCPYNDDPKNGTCKSLAPLLRDADAALRGQDEAGRQLQMAITNAEAFMSYAPYLAYDFANGLIKSAKAVVKSTQEDGEETKNEPKAGT